MFFQRGASTTNGYGFGENGEAFKHPPMTAAWWPNSIFQMGWNLSNVYTVPFRKILPPWPVPNAERSAMNKWRKSASEDILIFKSLLVKSDLFTSQISWNHFRSLCYITGDSLSIWYNLMFAGSPDFGRRNRCLLGASPQWIYTVREVEADQLFTRMN